MDMRLVKEQLQELDWVIDSAFAPHAVQITTLFMSPFNDCLTVVLAERGLRWYLSDRGWVRNQIRCSKIRSRKPGRIISYDRFIREAGIPKRVQCDGHMLLIETTSEDWIGDMLTLLKSMLLLLTEPAMKRRPVEPQDEVTDAAPVTEMSVGESSLAELPLDELQDTLSCNFVLQKKGEGRVGILTDFLYRDGDPCELFLTESPKPGGFRITDDGAALRRLGFILETGDELERTVERLALAQGLNFQDGKIFIDSSAEKLKANVLRLIVCLAQVSCLPSLPHSAS